MKKKATIAAVIAVLAVALLFRFGQRGKEPEKLLIPAQRKESAPRQATTSTTPAAPKDTGISREVPGSSSTSETVSPREDNTESTAPAPFRQAKKANAAASTENRKPAAATRTIAAPRDQQVETKVVKENTPSAQETEKRAETPKKVEHIEPAPAAITAKPATAIVQPSAPVRRHAAHIADITREESIAPVPSAPAASPISANSAVPSEFEIAKQQSTKKPVVPETVTPRLKQSNAPAAAAPVTSAQTTTPIPASVTVPVAPKKIEKAINAPTGEPVIDATNPPATSVTNSSQPHEPVATSKQPAPPQQAVAALPTETAASVPVSVVPAAPPITVAAQPTTPPKQEIAAPVSDASKEKHEYTKATGPAIESPAVLDSNLAPQPVPAVNALPKTEVSQVEQQPNNPVPPVIAATPAPVAPTQTAQKIEAPRSELSASADKVSAVTSAVEAKPAQVVPQPAIAAKTIADNKQSDQSPAPVGNAPQVRTEQPVATSSPATTETISVPSGPTQPLSVQEQPEQQFVAAVAPDKPKTPEATASESSRPKEDVVAKTAPENSNVAASSPAPVTTSPVIPVPAAPIPVADNVEDSKPRPTKEEQATTQEKQSAPPSDQVSLPPSVSPKATSANEAAIAAPVVPDKPDQAAAPVQPADIIPPTETAKLESLKPSTSVEATGAKEAIVAVPSNKSERETPETMVPAAINPSAQAPAAAIAAAVPPTAITSIVPQQTAQINPPQPKQEPIAEEMKQPSHLSQSAVSPLASTAQAPVAAPVIEEKLEDQPHSTVRPAASNPSPEAAAPAVAAAVPPSATPSIGPEQAAYMAPKPQLQHEQMAQGPATSDHLSASPSASTEAFAAKKATVATPRIEEKPSELAAAVQTATTNPPARNTASPVVETAVSPTVPSSTAAGHGKPITPAANPGKGEIGVETPSAPPNQPAMPPVSSTDAITAKGAAVAAPIAEKPDVPTSSTQPAAINPPSVNSAAPAVIAAIPPTVTPSIVPQPENTPPTSQLKQEQTPKEDQPATSPESLTEEEQAAFSAFGGDWEGPEKFKSEKEAVKYYRILLKGDHHNIRWYQSYRYTPTDQAKMRIYGKDIATALAAMNPARPTWRILLAETVKKKWSYPETVAGIARLAGSSGNKSLIPLLQEMQQHSAAFVRIDAAGALLALGEYEAALPILESHSREGHTAALGYIYRNLKGKKWERQGVELLQKAQGYDDRETKALATLFLINLRKQGVVREDPKKFEEALTAIGEEIVERNRVAAYFYRDRDHRTLEVVIRGFEELRSKNAIPLLKRIADHPEATYLKGRVLAVLAKLQQDTAKN